jgi:transcriptional regulator with XRE-family HTH domain
MACAGKNLRYLRTLFDLTVSSMAEEILQTGESNYRKMEADHSGITFNKAKLICDFFEISLHQLFETENLSLAKAISHKDEDYMDRILDKIKRLRDRPVQKVI